MPLFMVRNDITKMQVDAIVNPANTYLLEGSGTSYAIYQAAGEELLRLACRKIGYCELGQAVATEGFGLQARYIIHAVGPEWDDGYSNEEQTLYATYRNSLMLAKEKECETIAFPLLSSGNLGFPKERAMKAAVSAISDFLMEQDMTVYLVLYDRESLAVSEKLLGSIEQYIDDYYVDENDETLEGDELFSQVIHWGLEKRRANRFFQARKMSSIKREEQEDDFEDTRDALEELSLHSIQKAAKADEPEEIRSKETVVAPPDLCNSQPMAASRSLENLMDHLDETFSQMLLRLIDERGLKDSTVYKKANVDRRHFSKIRNNIDYVPTKKTVIAFSIALELTLDEAVDLLGRAGYAFSRSSKFDVIVCYFLENHIYDIFEINEVLFSYEQPILGE